MSGIKLPENLSERFEALSDDDATIKAKYAKFSEVINDEQKALALRAKSLWAQTINDMGLEGDWRYSGGKIYPVDPEPQK